MDSFQVSNAAIAIDNHIIGNSDNDFSRVYELSDYLNRLASPGPSKHYDELSTKITHSFLKTVEEYCHKTFVPGDNVRDLAEKLIIISHDLRTLVDLEDERKKRLRKFCVDLSNSMMNRDYTPICR